MNRKILFFIAVIVTSIVISSCNNSKSDKKTEKKSENVERDDIKYLEDFASFENSDQVAEYFGKENVKNDVWLVGEGTETYYVTIVNPDCKNKIVIFWEQESNDYKDFAFVKTNYSNYDSDYEPIDDEGVIFPAKNGVKVGTKLAKLEKLMGEPVVFYGFGWDFGGTVIDDYDKLENLVVTIGCFNLQDMTKKEMDAYQELAGDIQFSSNNAATKKLNIVVTEMTFTGN